MDIQHQTTLDLIQNEQKLDLLDLTQYAKYFSLLISSLLSCRNNYNCTPISRALKLDPVPNPLPPPANMGSGANLITHSLGEMSVIYTKCKEVITWKTSLTNCYRNFVLGTDHYFSGGGRGRMKNLALQTFLFIYAHLQTFFGTTPPCNYYFLITFLTTFLTHKGGSLLLPLMTI